MLLTAVSVDTTKPMNYNFYVHVAHTAVSYFNASLSFGDDKQLAE